jgi:hypothetical protein
MRFIEKAGAILAITAGLSAVGSQMPEVFGCNDASGNSATEWIGGDVEMPHCDEDNMSSVGNTLHDIGKLAAVVTFAGAATCGVVVTLKDRRRTASSGNL